MNGIASQPQIEIPYFPPKETEQTVNFVRVGNLKVFDMEPQVTPAPFVGRLRDVLINWDVVNHSGIPDGRLLKMTIAVLDSNDKQKTSTTFSIPGNPPQTGWDSGAFHYQHTATPTPILIGEGDKLKVYGEYDKDQPEVKVSVAAHFVTLK